MILERVCIGEVKKVWYESMTMRNLEAWTRVAETEQRV